MSSLTVFAIEGDKVTIPEFHARPLYEAISRDTPSDYQTIPGHHYAFIAPLPKRMTERKYNHRLAFLAEINTRIVAVFMRR